jgi:hypothetical protein
MGIHTIMPTRTTVINFAGIKKHAVIEIYLTAIIIISITIIISLVA